MVINLTKIEGEERLPIALNINKIDYFRPQYRGKGTIMYLISNSSLYVKESFDTVSKLIDKVIDENYNSSRRVP